MDKIEPSVFSFLSDLAENNDREWFHANKDRYETHAKMPFLEFLEHLRGKLNRFEPEITKTPVKKMLFRINRDTRFSKDKTPYKTHFAALLSPEGTKNKSIPANYLHISPDQSFIAGGAYFIESSDLLYRVRRHIFDRADRFQKLIESKDFTTKFGSIQGAKHKRIPKEFAEFEKNQPLIANRQFYWSAELDPAVLKRSGAADAIVDHIAAAEDLRRFFTEALGLDGETA